VKNLTFAHKQYEWIHKPGCVPNVTIDTNSSLGLDEDKYPYGAANASTDAAAICLELVPLRTSNDYGYSVATGNFSTEDMDEAMQEVTPSEDAIKAYLGDNLFDEFQTEDDAHLPYGNAHMRLQVGQARIRKLANFKKAYGGKTEYEWCLEQHKHDSDFPKACTGDGKEFAARPWQSRHKPRTAPEEAMEGVAYAIRNLIGEDHQEFVVDKTGAEAVGQVHSCVLSLSLSSSVSPFHSLSLPLLVSLPPSIPPSLPPSLPACFPTKYVVDTSGGEALARLFLMCRSYASFKHVIRIYHAFLSFFFHAAYL